MLDHPFCLNLHLSLSLGRSLSLHSFFFLISKTYIQFNSRSEKIFPLFSLSALVLPPFSLSLFLFFILSFFSSVFFFLFLLLCVVVVVWPAPEEKGRKDVEQQTWLGANSRGSVTGRRSKSSASVSSFQKINWFSTQGDRISNRLSRLFDVF